jgi:hypothetical protein
VCIQLKHAMNGADIDRKKEKAELEALKKQGMSPSTYVVHLIGTGSI